LALRGTGDLLLTGGPEVRPGLTPVLVAAYPTFNGEQGRVTEVTLLLDTQDRASQTLYTGFFRLTVRLEVDRPGEVVGPAQLLLTPESYRGPIQVSPDRSTCVDLGRARRGFDSHCLCRGESF
jgi:hypothetical protein